MSRFELSPSEREAIVVTMSATCSDATGVRLAYVFGSFARNEPFRDIDVAIVVDDAAAWRVPARVSQRIWEALNRPAFEIDVVVLNDATPAFRHNVVSHGRLLYEREAQDADDYRVRTVAEHLDLVEWKHAHGWT